MNKSYAELIPTFPIFQGFTLHGAQMILEAGEVVDYPAGTVVFREGDRAEFVLVVLTGRLEVSVNQGGSERIVGDSPPGTILGELAVLCGIPRSASVRAVENTAVLKWREDRFRRLLLGNQFLAEKIMSQSLRALIEKERTLLGSLVAAEGGGTTGVTQSRGLAPSS